MRLTRRSVSHLNSTRCGLVLVADRTNGPTNKPFGAEMSTNMAKSKATKSAATVKVAGHPNLAAGIVSTPTDLTPSNYAKVLAAGRAAGKAWLDGSDKPLVHMLRAVGIRVAITDKAERSATLAQYRTLVKAV